MSKVRSYIGFARKSRNLVMGTDVAIRYIEKNKVKLLIIAEDTSENTVKKLVNKAESNKVEYRIYKSSDELSEMAGTGGRTVFAITDDHFAKIIKKEIDMDRSIEKEVF